MQNGDTKQQDKKLGPVNLVKQRGQKISNEDKKAIKACCKPIQEW